MGPPRLRAVAARLAAEGRISPEAAPGWGAVAAAGGRDAPSPHVQAFAAAAAWLATLFLYGALACAGGLREGLWIPVGLAGCIAATLLRRGVAGVFPEQVALSASLTGEVLAIAGVAEGTGSAAATAAAALVLEGALLLLYPDAAHRAISAAGAAIASLVLVGCLEVAWLGEVAVAGLGAAVGAVWLSRPRDTAGRWDVLREPVRLGLVAALFSALFVSVLAPDFRPGEGDRWWFRPGPVATACLAGALLVLVLRVLRESAVPPASRAGIAALAGTAAVGALTLRAPGVVAGTGVLVLALRCRSRPLLGAGIVFLLLFGSAFYYWLEVTLLDKSLALLGSGAVLLILWFLFVRAGKGKEAAG